MSESTSGFIDKHKATTTRQVNGFILNAIYFLSLYIIFSDCEVGPQVDSLFSRCLGVWRGLGNIPAVNVRKDYEGGAMDGTTLEEGVGSAIGGTSSIVISVRY